MYELSSQEINERTTEIRSMNRCVTITDAASLDVYVHAQIEKYTPGEYPRYEFVDVNVRNDFKQTLLYTMLLTHTHVRTTQTLI